MFGKIGWKLTAGLATAGAAALARSALMLSWRAVRGSAPPRDAADLRATGAEALAWAGLSAAVVALARAAATRGAATGWQRTTGSAPPVKLDDK
jgi:hypothetical protein